MVVVSVGRVVVVVVVVAVVVVVVVVGGVRFAHVFVLRSYAQVSPKVTSLGPMSAAPPNIMTRSDSES